MRRLLVILCLLVVGAASSSPTRATILTACAEDVNCVFVGFVPLSGSGYDPLYSRFGLLPFGDQAENFPPNNMAETNSFAASDFWFSGLYNTFAWTTSLNFLVFFSSDNVPRITFQIVNNQTFNVIKRTASGINTTLMTCAPLGAPQVTTKIDVHIVYAVAGSISVFTNGTQICSYSGDVTTDGVTQLAYVGVSAMARAFSGHAGQTTWSQLIVADQDTRSLHLLTCAPAAPGNTQTWFGNASNINAFSYLDSSFNYTGANNQLSQWTIGCTIPGNMGITDVRTDARVARGSVGPQHFRFSLHDDGGDYNNGSDLLPMISFQNFDYDWGALSPATGLAWTAEEIQNLQSGLESTP